MKKLLTVSFLPLILFIGCDALDDLEACNEYTEDYNASATAFGSSLSSADCMTMADDIGVLVENDCMLNLAGTEYAEWEMADVDSFKTSCTAWDSL